MIIFGIIALIMLLGLSLAVIYLYFLLFVGLVGEQQYVESVPDYDFLILVPAHNEKDVIRRTLESLQRLDKIGRADITVIADNCTDSTAAIAREYGVTVLERTDEANRGKGYALEWAINQFDLDRFSAVAIVDADTIVESNMLKEMARSLESGAEAVQLYYGFSVEQNTALSYLQKMANIVENLFFYRPRSILKLPILLRGTGMAIKSGLLKNHPWESHSITEDVEYAVNLLVEGFRIDFNTESLVFAPATSSLDQSYSQKTRWASGTFELIKNKMWPLFKMGFKNARFDLVELGLSFLLLSRPLLIYIACIAIVLGLFASGGFNYIFALWGLLLILLLILYLLSGIIFISNKKAALKSLLYIPRYGFWFLLLQIKALLTIGRHSWKRTERKIDE